ncbi:hypothetical protein HY489_02020 [Candidatus Woesearchaeota archaeon]|nr:hypothetical protein [Candidatus Woesearchaeota archaeon]
MKNTKKAVRATKKLGKELVHVGKEVAHEAKRILTRDLKELCEQRIMTKQEAKSLAKSVMKELKLEGKRLLTFAKQEYQREKSKAKPFVKKAITRVKKGRR